MGALVAEYGYSANLENGQALCAAEAKKTSVTEADEITSLAARATRYGRLLDVLDKDTSSIAEEYAQETTADENPNKTSTTSLRK